MNGTRDRDDAAQAARDLAQLHAQAAAARAVLTRLQHKVAAAEDLLEGNQAAQMIEANEHLVLGILRAQTAADDAERGLDEVASYAQHDALTGLPNRLLLLDRFAHAIVSARRRGGRVALLFLDLDNFKQINDTLGHAAGDEALKHTAHCLTSCVREVDTVSRHGGDEFLILLTDVSQASDAAVIAEKLVAALATPACAGDLAPLAASIGISIYPEDGEDADTLISRADAAMYHAKRHGLGSFLFHNEQPPGEQCLEPFAIASLQRPLTHYELALSDHERRHVQMREANQQLLLAALDARDLQTAAEQAQQQQSRFLAMLAHELRNPLTPIRAAAALLNRVGHEELPRMQSIIERQVTHMTRLVGDLLDLSRVHTGKLRLERERVDLADVIAEAIDACQPAMDARKQHFDVQVPSGPLVVDGDHVRLAQVLSNLLDNASKYTPNGGDIGLRVEVLDDAVVLRVTDSGIGITAEALPDVFDPFVQDPHATGFNGVGLGIGLTVVRELVEAHGGSVVASSAGPGLGSAFVVTVPLARHED